MWPEDDQPLGNYARVKGYIIATITLGISFFQFSALLEAKDLDVALEYIIEAMASVTASIKVLSIIVNRDNVIELLRMTKKICESSKTSETDIKISKQWNIYQDNLIKTLIPFYFGVLLTYLCFPIFKDRGLPLQGLLPKILLAAPWYHITYFIEIVISLFRFIGVISSDVYCVIFLCQLCSELECMKYSIKNFEKNEKNDITKIIDRHAFLLDYGGIVCDLLSIMFIIQYVIFGFFLCLTGIVAIYVESILLMMKMIPMVIISIISMLIMCLVGETITNSSLAIGDAINSVIYRPFFEEVKSLKLINFVLLRAQKSLCLMVCGQGSMNLCFFTESMNKIVSFFLFLKTLIE